MTSKEDEARDKALNEVKLLKRIDSQAHLAQILDHCEDECLQKVHIFLEEAGDLTLDDLMEKHKEGLSPDVADDLFG